MTKKEKKIKEKYQPNQLKKIENGLSSLVTYYII